MTCEPPPDVPDDWPRPYGDEIEEALRIARAALSDDSARPATQRLAAHYDPAGRGAGTTFLELSPVAPTTVTAADLHALTVLNAPVNALTTRRLLDDEDTRADIKAALARLEPTADLATADWTTFLAMEALSQPIQAACRDPWASESNPWVTAAKLCARKRPRLFPVRDNVVCKGLGLFGTSRRRLGDRRVDWQVFACLMRDRELVDRIDELAEQVRTAHGVRCDSVPLRVLDVALWTWLRN
ncbi:hypothetical protein SAMN04488107_0053 [Geodermatophilus saharensis]|uniref:Uncharacterized protein n=1 Tax=Geodermatophilus saharensis TaxID=1137994 RepID=A0A238ZGH1_9ACTN|nr:DUF6308 family protein [Geodermatophilus saharensis]SNR82222.1 hypothetical protein SAMN04488107_0053 [Geodermatophilus saharensis]